MKPMPCNCSDDRPGSSSPTGCAYLAYSGGPLDSIYCLVEQAIPPDAKLIHGRPMVFPDGSLEFPGPPPPLSGYRENGSRLYPVWPPCALRILKVEVIEGLLRVEGVCGKPDAAQFSREVTVARCCECLETPVSGSVPKTHSIRGPQAIATTERQGASHAATMILHK